MHYAMCVKKVKKKINKYDEINNNFDEYKYVSRLICTGVRVAWALVQTATIF